MNLTYMLEANGKHVGTFESESALRSAARAYTGSIKMYIYDGPVLVDVSDVEDL